MSEDAPAVWPLSIAATVLVWLGYVPELRRLCRQRSAAGTSWLIWVIWIGSSGLQLAYTLASGASPLVVANCGTVFGLTAVVAAWNGYYVATAVAPPPHDAASTSTSTSAAV